MIINYRRLTSILCILGIISSAGLFSACDMMGGIYDDTLDGKDSQQNETSDSNSNKKEEATTKDKEGNDVTVTVISGELYIDATSYTKWHYISLRDTMPVITTSDISIETKTESDIPEEWDFALHRYDVKTNGASVMMTTFHSISELEAAGMPADGIWVGDVYSENSVTIDMSHMLEGYLVYAPGYKNTEAGKWLNVDTSSMPPNYTLYDNVMIYRFSDGTYAAIQLVDFMSNDKYKIKGWMTVNYKYPIFI